MRPENINKVCHRWISEIIKDSDVCCDMTMGNGFDTLFLAQNCQKVYAFDIQKEALKNTEQRVKEYSNVELILDSHFNFDSYVDRVDIFVFNLGYLPKGDISITTKAETTMATIRKAIEHLDGHIFVTFYVGHPEGKKEHETFIADIDDLDIEIERQYDYYDRNDSPVLYQLKKKDHQGLSSIIRG